MLFNSIEFFVFLAAVFPVYFLAHRFGPRGPVLVLLIASLIFYAWWACSTCGCSCSRSASIMSSAASCWGARPNRANARATFCSPSVLQPILGCLSSSNISISFLRDVLGHDPLGISFYTFTQIAFLVDARRGDIAANDPLSYGLFVTYFLI
jgi:alginate O-acetyltransferase complex protein AlgI